MEIGKGISRSIWRTKEKDHKPTYTCSFKEKRKILGKNRYFRTCYRESSISRARRKIETYYIFVKNNATSRKKLWNLQQRTTCSSRGPYKMEAISTEYYREVWSLDRSQKSQIFQRTTQTQWTTSKMVFEVTRLWLHIIPHTRENKHQGWFFIKERLSRYQERQQRCSDC